MRTITIQLTDEQEAGLEAALAARNERIARANTEADAEHRRAVAAWDEAAGDYEARKAAYVPLPRRRVLTDEHGATVTRKDLVRGQLVDVEVLHPHCLEAQGLSEAPAEFPPMPPRPTAPTPKPLLTDPEAIVQEHVAGLLRMLERHARRGRADGAR